MNVMGLYSGIDMSMVDQLIEAEAAKGVRFTQQKEKYTNSQNAWKDMNTRLDSLYKRLEDLQNPDTFNSKSVEVKGPETVNVSTDTSAATGEYRLNVQQLATQSRLTGERVNTSSIDTALDLDGSVTINSGTDAEIVIDVEAGDSLKSISEKINAQSTASGVRSSIVDNRLIFTQVEFGNQPITVDADSALSDGLGLTDASFTSGKNALFSIDGLMVERATNTIDDVIEGVSFNLINAHSGDDTTIISVTEDLDKAAEAVQKFVDQYNSTQSFITSQLSVGDPLSSDNKSGTLSGDGTLMRLQSSLRSMMTSRESHGTSLKGLQDLGVTVDRNGTATFDRGVLETAVKTNPNELNDFFSSSRVTNEDGETSTVNKGFSRDMRSFVNQYISSSNGIIKTRQDTYERMIRDVNQRIERFDERLAMRKDRYIRQFSALDTAMMKAESQMDFMFSQLGMD